MDAAVKSLLQRFDYSLEHGIRDTREKETAMKGILRFEKSASFSTGTLAKIR